MEDQEFINNFSAVLAAVVAIVVFIFILAIGLSSKDETMDMAMEKRTKERIAPISRVNVGEVAAVAMTPAADAMAEATPEQIYQSACHACHAAGVLEAPRLEDRAAWQTRYAQGLEVLYQSVINGKGNMPAKGGRIDLSDDAIRKTVDYMLEAAGLVP
ncbi:MAG: c-type cytochrome [Gammaproteobacteria bacterium]|nr:c-type cytochrome [Gammaproteobacteria bacterium]